MNGIRNGSFPGAVLNTVVDDSLEAFINMVIDLAKETHKRRDTRQAQV
jgi:hypothetical protein